MPETVLMRKPMGRQHMAHSPHGVRLANAAAHLVWNDQYQACKEKW